MLRNTHKKQRSKLRVLPGPICCRFVGAVGTGSLLLFTAAGVSSSSLMITERRTSVVLQKLFIVIIWLILRSQRYLAVLIATSDKEYITPKLHRYIHGIYMQSFNSHFIVAPMRVCLRVSNMTNLSKVKVDQSSHPSPP